jgi:hypothetical protein
LRDRRNRNLLSSMPLCFNLFAKLHCEPAAAATVLGVVLGLDVATVEEVLVEHAPPAAKQLLGDRTAIETKYTEPFSPTSFPPGRYEPSPAFTAAGFAPGAAARLAGPATNQLLRNTLLAAATRHTGGYDLGHAVVLTGRDDRAARRAVGLVRAELAEPDRLLRWLSLERLVEQCQLEARLASWAARFRRRYLDLSPVASRFPVPADCPSDGATHTPKMGRSSSEVIQGTAGGGSAARVTVVPP